MLASLIFCGCLLVGSLRTGAVGCAKFIWMLERRCSCDRRLDIAEIGKAGRDMKAAIQSTRDRLGNALDPEVERVVAYRYPVKIEGAGCVCDGVKRRR